ncbi:hypothetical protein GLV94_18520 [Virgibacillus halodenitrificans]|uniref:hypothetical protein n=1 Tax=Virgibacillus halodenitrificans TaxID=1482 RepID=UPI001369DD19|nr:hypothetical protein [Virgibacillus halodenitrificans]MYL47638.1 hypothetical protein [Virgibacillus halodenitrificans]
MGNPIVLEDKEDTKNALYYPNNTKTLDSTDAAEGKTKILDDPNNPSISINIDKKEKKEEEQFPTKKTDPSNTENNLTNSNYTTAIQNYKVMKY